MIESFLRREQQAAEAIDNILIIDDDQALSDLVSQFLSDNGYSVACAYDGITGIQAVADQQPDLVILDLMLPGVDGLTVCKEIRHSYLGPVIMLTALNDEIDEVTGLEVGADDYLAKPIKPRVLLAHIRAQLRRSHFTQKLQDAGTLIFGSGAYRISSGSRQVEKNQNTIIMTTAEFDLLWMLAESVGEVVSREELHDRIFQLPYDGQDRSIDLRISRLRKKLGDSSGDPQLIKTIRNIGYLLAR